MAVKSWLVSNRGLRRGSAQAQMPRSASITLIKLKFQFFHCPQVYCGIVDELIDIAEQFHYSQIMFCSGRVVRGISRAQRICEREGLVVPQLHYKIYNSCCAIVK